MGLNARQATFDYLEKMPNGRVFTGMQLRAVIYRKTGQQRYPATTLRYMRIYRHRSTRVIECIDKAKSKYRIDENNEKEK